jgi:AraC-like DNA-binding protein
MSYQSAELAKLVHAELRRRPTAKLGELAQKIGVDRHTLARAVRATHGVSFREFRTTILSVMIQAQVCTRPSASIKEISATFGYGHSQSFSRMVRRVTGIAPTKLRH